MQRNPKKTTCPGKTWLLERLLPVGIVLLQGEGVTSMAGGSLPGGLGSGLRQCHSFNSSRMRKAPAPAPLCPGDPQAMDTTPKPSPRMVFAPHTEPAGAVSCSPHLPLPWGTRWVPDTQPPALPINHILPRFRGERSYYEK